MQVSYRVEHNEATGDYIASCPLMKPVSVYGKSESEVEGKMIEAIKLYLKKHPDAVEKIRMSEIEM